MTLLNQKSSDRIRATLPGEGQLEGLMGSWGVCEGRVEIWTSHTIKQSEETHQEVSCFLLSESPQWVKSIQPAKVCQAFL